MTFFSQVGAKPALMHQSVAADFQLSSGLAVGRRTRGRAKAGVAGIYNRSLYAAEKRAALDLWAKPHSNPAGRRPPAETDMQEYFRVSRLRFTRWC